jgi:hypothetical protein
MKTLLRSGMKSARGEESAAEANGGAAQQSRSGHFEDSLERLGA